MTRHLHPKTAAPHCGHSHVDSIECCQGSGQDWLAGQGIQVGVEFTDDMTSLSSERCIAQGVRATAYPIRVSIEPNAGS